MKFFHGRSPSVSIFVGAISVLISLFTLSFLVWKFAQLAEDEPTDYETSDEYETTDEYKYSLSDCLEIAVSFDQRWMCLTHDVTPGLNPDAPALQIFRLSNRSKLARERRRLIRKKRTPPEPKMTYSDYVPYDKNYIIRFKPVTFVTWFDEERQRGKYNDYRKFMFGNQTSPYFYRFENTDQVQEQPPWSYSGIHNPKEWHKLSISKFLTPIDQNLSPRQASFRDLRFEFLVLGRYLELMEEFFSVPMEAIDEDLLDRIGRVYLGIGRLDLDERMALIKTLFIRDKDEHGRSLLHPEAILAGNDTLSKFMNYTLGNQDIALDKLDTTLIDHDPNNGAYSSMRFLLPPPISDEELSAYRLNPQAELDRYFVRASRNRPDLKFLAEYASENDKEPLILDMIKSLEESKVAIPHPHNITTFVKQVEEDAETFEHEFSARFRYSLPLFPKIFPICRHKEPSPINIITENAVTGNIGKYHFNDRAYSLYRFRAFFPDDGTNVFRIKFEGGGRALGDAVILRGGAIKGQDLFFDEMHVHIGKNDTSGSEHRINGQGYAMELQLIFSLQGSDHHEPYYYTLARQVNDLFPFRGKLVTILSVLVKVVDKPTQNTPYLFEPLAQVAAAFRHEDEQDVTGKKKKFRGYSSREPVMILSEFIPKDSAFYTYRGSLTIPPCFSYVMWSVFEKPLEITREQFEELKILPTPEQDNSLHLAGNVRQIEDEWVEEENVEGMTEKDKAILREKRQNRVVIKSYSDDFALNYDDHSGNGAKPLILLPINIKALFLIPYIICAALL